VLGLAEGELLDDGGCRHQLLRANPEQPHGLSTRAQRIEQGPRTQIDLVGHIGGRRHRAGTGHRGEVCRADLDRHGAGSQALTAQRGGRTLGQAQQLPVQHRRVVHIGAKGLLRTHGLLAGVGDHRALVSPVGQGVQMRTAGFAHPLL